MSIDIENVTKKFGSYTALDDINLNVASGELVALLGPSGCGKTTLLRIIAGLEQPDSGTIGLSGRETTSLRPGQRNVGFVFQHYALFRHLSVYENVAFGLKVLPRKERPAKAEIKARVHELLTMVQMEWAAERLPSQLSGGQRQRVALARALAVKPQVLLLDEPFSALDAKVRLELRRWLRKLHDDMHITSVFVTHDQEEALELADRIVIVNKGRIEQQGSPEAVYDKPANAFVYNFLGNINIFHCRTDGGKLAVTSGAAPAGPEHDLSGQSVDSQLAQGFVRPHEVQIRPLRQSDADLEAVISDTRTIGAQIGVELQCLGLENPVEAELSRDSWKEMGLKKGDRVYVSLERMAVFPIDYSI